MDFRFKYALALVVYSLCLFGCKPASSSKMLSDKSVPAEIQLGDLNRCEKYSGLPQDWLKHQYSGMVKISAGEFKLGSNQAYADEFNFGAPIRKVDEFWIDQTEVTVAQFASFVQATNYVTDAEKQQEAAVFSPDSKQPHQWWKLKSGYTWQYPNGTGKEKAQANEPVRFVTQNDAARYALWLGRDLPTEIEWEYAAKAGGLEDTPLHQAPTDHQQRPIANYWQGEFPFQNLKQDQFESVAPVGCFQANAFGIYDQIGNVWEWTNSVYQGAHDQHMGDYQSLRKNQQSHPNYVIKGGSYLCAQNYCSRFRNSSRYPQELDLATSHVGFRTISRIKDQ